MVFGIYDDLIGKYWLIFGTIIFAIVYQTVIRYWNYFSKNGVKFVRGWPVIGSMYRMLLGKEAFAIAFQNMYNKYPNERFIGMYEMMGIPAYLIRDPELVKQISIKDFDHFVNHRFTVDEHTDALLSRSLFTMRDGKWRDMRATVSPAFTGSKMRLMLALVAECSKKFTNHLIDETKGSAKVYDLHDLFTRFASNSIATSSFGIEVDALKDRQNKFYKMGLEVTNFKGKQGLKFFGYQSIPRFMKFFKISFFTDEQITFFRNLVDDNIGYREKHNIVRNDMIHLMMEAKKGKLIHNASDNGNETDMGFATVEESDLGKSSKKLTEWDDDDIVAQCMVFFLAGFSAITGSVSFMAHELAVNQDIQQRLYEEVVEMHKELKGEPVTYEAVQKMKYLDMVVSEVLRRWALSPANDRYVNKPYVLENYDGTKVQLNVGDGLWFPTYAMHMDPKYFPNPEKFDPERFSDANKGNIVSGSYFPFGTGPRSCVGSRFALMQMKSIFVYLLLHFSIEKCAKTQDPLKLLANTSILMEGEKGFWASLKPRVTT